MKRPLRSARLWQIAFVAMLALLVVIVYGFAAALLLGRASDAPLPQVRIIVPGAETLVMAGQTLRVQVESRGAPVAAFELWDDDQPLTATDELLTRNGVTSASHEWRAGVAGVHHLSVRALGAADRNGSGGAPSRTPPLQLGAGAHERIAASEPITVFVAPTGQIAFVSNRTGRYRLHLMLTSGDSVTALAANDQEQREPGAGTAGNLPFVTRDAQGNADIWLARNLGAGLISRLENLTAAPAARSSPALSPQGDTLAYAGTRQAVGELYVWTLSGGAPRLIVSGLDEIAHPTWSPDGARLAFMGRTQRNADIYVVNRDGSAIRRLTSDQAVDGQPAWSPAGAVLAFVSNRSGVNQVYVMRPDGSGAAALTAMPAGAEQPAWSPDGLWLVFVAHTGLGPRNDARELYLMRSDGADPMRLTRNAYDDTEPIWAP